MGTGLDESFFCKSSSVRVICEYESSPTLARVICESSFVRVICESFFLRVIFSMTHLRVRVISHPCTSHPRSSSVRVICEYESSPTLARVICESSSIGVICESSSVRVICEYKSSPTLALNTPVRLVLNESFFIV
ncbi:hypothetical protein O6H91_20G031600 [Diphasiastrum complanatum]|uniref:Uncharacterized protein n=1 Tax=Diphasiastrum complanatum TaxID=34168 RepID=A0ACC2ANU8_DIPCM|nr:hypothetical protein O6H91_20G031600 [Diphasiastrum complanatum]